MTIQEEIWGRIIPLARAKSEEEKRKTGYDYKESDNGLKTLSRLSGIKYDVLYYAFRHLNGLTKERIDSIAKALDVSSNHLQLGFEPDELKRPEDSPIFLKIQEILLEMDQFKLRDVLEIIKAVHFKD